MGLLLLVLRKFSERLIWPLAVKKCFLKYILKEIKLKTSSEMAAISFKITADISNCK